MRAAKVSLERTLRTCSRLRDSGLRESSPWQAFYRVAGLKRYSGGWRLDGCCTPIERTAVGLKTQIRGPEKRQDFLRPTGWATFRGPLRTLLHSEKKCEPIPACGNP